jgi:hypothetical protein
MLNPLFNARRSWLRSVRDKPAGDSSLARDKATALARRMEIGCHGAGVQDKTSAWATSKSVSKSDVINSSDFGTIILENFHLANGFQISPPVGRDFEERRHGSSNLTITL